MFSTRRATPADIPVILYFVRALAAYEREPGAVKATEADLLRDGFGETPCWECLLAEEQNEEPNGKGFVRPAGFALYFPAYSTWRGRPRLHLEDLFVLPEFRGRGIGKALLAQVAARAVEQGFQQLGWDVLEWNRSAIDFYRSAGARMLGEWRIMRVADDALTALAAGEPCPERFP